MSIFTRSLILRKQKLIYVLHNSLLSTSSSSCIFKKEGQATYIPTSLRKFLTARNENMGQNTQLIYNSRMDFFAQTILLANFGTLTFGSAWAMNFVTPFTREYGSFGFLSSNQISVIVSVTLIQFLALNILVFSSPMRIYYDEVTQLYEARYIHPFIPGITSAFKFNPNSGKMITKYLPWLIVNDGYKIKPLIVSRAHFKAPIFYRNILSQK